MLKKDDPNRLKLDTERAAHWLKCGAQPADKVARFLDTAGLMKRTVKVSLPRRSRKTKPKSVPRPSPIKPRPPLQRPMQVDQVNSAVSSLLLRLLTVPESSHE